MTTLTGRTLSHYRLEAKIGAGGMGEVYRGIDTRLNRPLAVKILPPDLLQDDDRRRRFTQEAKAASALNHPNIVTIYDVGSEDGFDFIVMEHVDGKTLQEHIGRRPMAIGPLLRCATQIADALAAAHAAGIVHRDLKPTNVMVTGQGVVKVLDFGLAKLAEGPAPAGADHTRTALAAGSPTERGMVVGTASYMSPEQAEGGAVDARSDIFSFGSVLYEMATGRRAFHGTTTMSTIAAVLRDDPPPLSTITSVPLPHDLEVLINRCLKKDPSRRVQHMADLKVALQELNEDSESGRLMTSAAPVTAPGRRAVWPIAAVAAGAAALTAAAAGWFAFGRTSDAPRSFEQTRLTFNSSSTAAGAPALSRDGKLVVYNSNRATKTRNLWLQQVDGGEAVQLTKHEDDAGSPDFSPDGTRIVYTVPQGKEAGIYVIATIGGEPKKVAPQGFVPKFSPDGSRLLFAVSDQNDAAKGRLMVAPATGGPATTVPGDFRGFAAVWSPDGNHLLALGTTDPKAPPRDAVDWFAISVSDGTAVRTGAAAALRAQKVLRAGDNMPPPADWNGGAVLFSAAGDVWRVPVDPARFHLSGPAEQVTSGTADEISPSMSLDGKLVFSALDSFADYWTLPIDANAASVIGERKQIITNSASDRLALSLDGTTLFFCAHRGRTSEIRSRDLRTGKETAIVTTEDEQHVNGATADGSTVLYLVVGEKRTRFLATRPGAPPRKVCEECGHPALSSDASKLMYVVEPDHKTYHLLEIGSGQSRELVKTAKYGMDAAAISPDGKWAVVTTLSGPLLLMPVRDSLVDEKEMIQIGKVLPGLGYFWPTFSPDGAAIYYVSNSDGHDCVYAQRLSASRQPAGDPVAVAHLHEANALGHPHGMAVGADKIVLLMNQGSSNIWMMQPRR